VNSVNCVNGVNRWSRWAARIRRRHGRSDLRRSAARMVLARNAGAFTQVLMATHRTLVRVEARLGVTQVLMPPMRCGQARTVVPEPVAVLRFREIASAPGSRVPALRLAPAPAPSMSTVSAPRFVDGALARTVRAVRQRQEQGGAPAIPALVARWQRPAAIAADARDVPARLRRSATRQELPIVDKLTVLASPHRGPADGPTARGANSATTMAPARTRADEVERAVAPPINVEALTTQVIQQLDRRLVAYRERMGRS